MVRLVLVCSLAFLVSGCALDALSRPPLTPYGGAPSSAKASKPKVAHVAKPKAATAPVKSASQPAATDAKPKKNKTWKWYAPWRKKDG